MSAYEASDDVRTLRLLAARLPERAVIYDIGSSNGSWTWHAVHAFPKARIELFDPLLESDEYQQYLRNIVALDYDLRTHPIAIGDRDGDAPFYVAKQAVNSTSLNWGVDETFATRQQVRMRRLDSMLSADEIPFPDLIKLDIQGGEMNALRGARRALESARAIVVETWLTREYGPETPLLSEMIAYLAPFGFRLFDVGHVFRLEDEVAYSVDVAFIKDSQPVPQKQAGMKWPWFFLGASSRSQ